MAHRDLNFKSISLIRNFLRFRELPSSYSVSLWRLENGYRVTGQCGANDSSLSHQPLRSLSILTPCSIIKPFCQQTFRETGDESGAKGVRRQNVIQ